MSVDAPHHHEADTVVTITGRIHAELAKLENHTHAAIVTALGNLFQHRVQHLQAQQHRAQAEGTNALNRGLVGVN